MPIFSIILLTYNHLGYTRLCVESIRRSSPSNHYELIIIDNASTDNTPKYLANLAQTHAQIKVVCNPTNRGFAAGNNQGATLATGEYLVFLNNDTIVTPGWLEGLRAHFDNNQKAGMIGPVTNDIGNEAKVDTAYRNLDEIDHFARQRALSFGGQSFQIRMLAMYCMMMRRSLFEQIGGLDERFGLGTFEDDDLAMRVRQAGFEILCAEDVFIHHFHSVSFDQLGSERLQELFSVNKKLFEEKWQQPWQPHQYRDQVSFPI